MYNYDKTFVRAKSDNRSAIISRNGSFCFFGRHEKADIENSVLEYLPILTS